MKRSRFKFKNPGRLTDRDLTLILVEKRPADPDRNRSPCYVFQMRKVSGTAKIGSIRLRIDSTAKVRFPGHIGFDVDPKYRGDRYAARSCRLLLPLARAHGLRSLWITCGTNNAASRRSCELVGGTYVETIRIPKHHEMYKKDEHFLRRYRINLLAELSNGEL